MNKVARENIKVRLKLPKKIKVMTNGVRIAINLGNNQTE